MSPSPARLNVASLLRESATRRPRAAAIVSPAPGPALPSGEPRNGWRTLTYADLDLRSDAVAAGLAAAGFARGERTLVMVRAGVELITLAYALFKLGAVPVLIDPGMGLSSFLRCVERTAPSAFVGIPLAHAARLVFRRSFRTVRRHATVGRRWLWSGVSVEALGRDVRSDPRPLADTAADETAAVLFTSGSTGPAKGAVYTHSMFVAQVEILRRAYRFEPGEVDLAAFPLFSLFDAAFEMTSVIPDLDPSRPGRCHPARVVSALREHRCTTAFGSPAIWRRVAPWCVERGVRLPDLHRVLIAGASVPPSLVEQLHRVLPPEGDVHTPYGATEALPVATIAGREVVGETAALTRDGKGTCVGRPVEGTDVAVIRVDDGPIAAWSDELLVPDGTVGELCARGPVVTREYHGLPEATAAAKIPDGETVWHRLGDLGYRDAAGRLWFCGRKAERLETAAGPLHTDPVEGLAAAVPGVSRCALVGVGPRGSERPVLVLEGSEDAALAREVLARVRVEAVLFHPRFPVDVRHNAKIHRGTLKRWAEARLTRGRGTVAG